VVLYGEAPRDESRRGSVSTEMNPVERLLVVVHSSITTVAVRIEPHADLVLQTHMLVRKRRTRQARTYQAVQLVVHFDADDVLVRLSRYW